MEEKRGKGRCRGRQDQDLRTVWKFGSSAPVSSTRTDSLITWLPLWRSSATTQQEQPWNRKLWQGRRRKTGSKDRTGDSPTLFPTPCLYWLFGFVPPKVKRSLDAASTSTATSSFFLILILALTLSPSHLHLTLAPLLSLRALLICHPLSSGIALLGRWCAKPTFPHPPSFLCPRP
jgi:hypothetical protein